MQVYVDSADPADWLHHPGVPRLAGATTNPTLVHQTGRAVTLATCSHLLNAAAAAGLPALMLQLPQPDVAEGLAWSRALRHEAAGQLALTFKLPCTPNWQPLVRALIDDGAETLLTALSNPVQLLWAAECGVTWVAPYLGRMEAAGRDVWPLVEACVAVQRSGGPRLLAASIRTGEALAKLVACGAAGVTLRPQFLLGHAHDPLTEEATAQFARDAGF